NLDRLIGAHCLTFKDHDYTARDVIKAAAHLKGGVHAGKPETARDMGLLDLDEVLRVGGIDASLAALRCIINVVLRGLQPLVDAIAKANVGSAE
ncbi:MAG: hypothetical protein V3T70_02425, partial [Phycisphaerae bacterium]